jgi:hypothetical protein
VLSPAAEELIGMVRAACLKSVTPHGTDHKPQRRIRSRKEEIPVKTQ